VGEPVDLVDEQDVVLFQVGENGRQIAGALDDRTRGGLDVHPHLGGDDVGQGGLAQAGRTVEQHVIQ